MIFFSRVGQILALLVLTVVLSACSTTFGKWVSTTSFAGPQAPVQQGIPYKRTTPITATHSAKTPPSKAALAKIGLSSDNAATADYFSQTEDKADGNLWNAIRRNFQMKHYSDNSQVKAQIDWFMHNQKYLDRTARRAAPYMYYIFQQVKARHLPSELVLLPIIESAYDPFVSSSAGAVGLWQLEPVTARNFGVQENWWYDGSRDILASTNAALDYLTYLQNFFGGNWLFSIASYNAGQGTVQSDIHYNARLGRPTDFWSLPLPLVTHNYVLRLLALAAIVNDPSKYGISLPPISNAPYLSEVEISSKITFEQAAQLAGISLNELKILNPGYRHNTADPNEPYKLLLPIDHVQQFRQNLLNTPATSGSLWGRYKVQHHDTWFGIAHRFHTTEALLKEVNNIHTWLPPVGKVLLIPENSENQTAIAAEKAKNIFSDSNREQEQTTSSSSTSTQGISSDVSSSAAVAMSNSPDQPNLAQAARLDAGGLNAVARDNALAEERAREAVLHREYYTVRPGNTLDGIARQFGVSVEDLRRWNHLSAHSDIRIGMKLVFYRHEEYHPHPVYHHPEYHGPVRHVVYHHEPVKHHPVAAQDHWIHYDVRPGDNLTSIADHFGISVADILHWNGGLTAKSALHPGQTLAIYAK